MIPEEEPFPFFITAEETGQKNRNLQDFTCGNGAGVLFYIVRRFYSDYL